MHNSKFFFLKLIYIYLARMLTQLPELLNQISHSYNTSKKKMKNEMTAEGFTITCHNT